MPSRSLLSVCLLLVCLLLSSPALLVADEPAWAFIGPDGGSVRTLAASRTSPAIVYAALQQGGRIFRGTGGVQSWTEVADLPGVSSIFDLAVSANGAFVFAATDVALLRSADGGTTWDTLQEGAFTAVEVHPGRPRVVLAIRSGILIRSADRGATWETPVLPVDMREVVFASGRNGAAWAGGVNGLWKSTDAGRTWTRAQGLPETGTVSAIAVDPLNARMVLVSFFHPRRALFRSGDGGATWVLSQRGLAHEGILPNITDLLVTPAASNVVFAIAGGQLFRSLNGGRFWTLLPASPARPGAYISDLEPAGSAVLAAAPGGVSLTTDRGAVWHLRSNGLTATAISGLAIDTQNPPRLYAADIQAGIFKTRHRGRPWLRLGQIDEPFTWYRPLLIDPSDPETLWAGTLSGIAKSTNGGRRWTVHPGLGCVTAQRIALDPRVPSHLYAYGSFITGGCGLQPNACILFRSLDAGESWECIRQGLPGNIGGVLQGVDAFNSAVYVQVQGGDLWRSLDNGATWQPLFSGLGATSFLASPRVPGTLWAGRTGNVGRSRDGGQTWQLFSTGLPAEAPVLALAADPSDDDTLYAAVEAGVFKSTDAGETWSPAGVWPADTAFSGTVVVDPVDPSIVYAGTETSGVVRLDQSGN